jgi:glutathione synthase/RimK-type ligase-like ATP-grasp enzyme
VHLCQEKDIDVLLPVGEAGIRCTSANSEPFTDICSVAPFPDTDAFDLAVDKSRLAEFLIDRHLPGLPDWDATVLRSRPDLWETLPFPVLLKARRGSFGRQITYVATASDLGKALSNLNDETGDYFVQPYLSGRDVDCSVLCQGGEILAHTIQRERVPARFGTFQPPVVVEFVHDEQVLEIVRPMMKALDWTGVAHVDLRRDSNTGGLYVLEINARFWGSILGSVLVGVNMPHLACLAARNIPFEVPKFRPGLYFARGIAGRAGDQKGLRYDWRRSNLPFVLRDPVPEIMGRLRRSTGRKRH